MSENVAAVLARSGWHPSARLRVSPNHDARPVDARIELVVLHAISLPPGQFGGETIIDFFCNRLDCSTHPYFSALRGVRVSAHFLLRRTGEIVQFVSCHERAWHAGISCWRGRQHCNDFSLGIELEGDDLHPFTEAQYRSLITLLQPLVAAFPIREIVGHHDIAAGRKTDPGPSFEWRRLYRVLPDLVGG